MNHVEGVDIPALARTAHSHNDLPQKKTGRESQLNCLSGLPNDPLGQETELNKCNICALSSQKRSMSTYTIVYQMHIN